MRAMSNRQSNSSALSVSIVLHNNPPEMLRSVLESLQQSCAMAHAGSRLGAARVELLDNSTDQGLRRDAADMARAWPRTDYFSLSYSGLPANLGFGAGHNEAVRQLDSDFHLVLNPDAVLAEDALQQGLARLQNDNGAVLVSPRVEAADGSQEFLCKRYPTVLVLLLRAFAPESLRQRFRSRLDRYEMRDLCSNGAETDVLLASGCCMLVRSAALRSVGGFDERYFLYFEDFDLSIRLAAHGRLVYSPAFRIVHHGGYAASKGVRHVRYFIRSGIRFFRRHGWRWI
jgi:GT2 family glycosyltransferase